MKTIALLVIVCSLFSVQLMAQDDIDSLQTQIDSLKSDQESGFKKLFAKLDSLKDNHDSSRIVLLSVGGNLDFLEKVKLNGVYFDLAFNIPTMVKDTSQCEFLQRLGLEGRVSQGRFVSKLDSSNIYGHSYFTDFTDSTTVRHLDIYKQTSSYTTSYLAGQLAPSIRIWGKKPEKNALYFLLYTDFHRMQTKNNITLGERIDSLSMTDTVALSPNGVYNRLPVPIVRGRDRIVYSFITGGGLRYNLNTEFVSLSAKFILGAGHILQPGASYESFNGMYYVMQVEAFENKLGFKVGFEMRGITMPTREGFTAANPFYTPLISFYFAKTINFANLKALVAG